MSQHDFFTNSIFIEQKIQDKINFQLNVLFEHLINMLEQQQIRANLYLTGSLARKEPSVSKVGDTYNLYSDIDLLIAVDIMDLEHSFWKKISRKQTWDGYNISFYLNTISQFPQFRSGVGRDLFLCQTEPIYFKIPTTIEPVTNLNNQEISLELIIHQLASYYLHPYLTRNTMYARDQVNYHYVKLILELLRGLLADEGGEDDGFFCLYKKKINGRLEGILSDYEVAMFIKSRELFGTTVPPKVSVPYLLQIYIGRYFGVDYSKEIPEALSQATHSWKGIIQLYKLTIISYVLSKINRTRSRKEFWVVFIQCLTLLQYEYPYVLSYLNKINGFDEDSSEYTLHLLGRLRQDYLKKLHQHNLGNTQILQ